MTKDSHGYYGTIETFFGASDGARALRRIGEKARIPTFNLPAALFGPLWWGARKMPGVALVFSLLELIGFGRLLLGLFGDLGGDQLQRAAILAERGTARAELAARAVSEKQENAEFLTQSAENMIAMSAKLMAEGQAAATEGLYIAVTAVIFLLIVKIIEGLIADRVLLRRYSQWRNGLARDCVFSVRHAIVTGLFFIGAIVVFAQSYILDQAVWQSLGPQTGGLRSHAAAVIDESVAALTESASWFFDSIKWSINFLLNGVETLFLAPPWPITALFVIVLAWLSVGVRTAIFASAALLYLGLFGFWDASLRTIALLGTAAIIAIVLGIPIGILCARRPWLYDFVRPILDFMQTMPAFVYLIPVIALFGIGKPPGVVATLFFGMPPIIRLTVLGLRGVPQDTVEAARAFGASDLAILLQVELPLARQSIMTGINQTIMMSLGMVVIASLIGSKGLGQDVLESLQYAAIGSGMLAGLAILCCAMLLDRIVQGREKSTKMDL